MLDKNMFQIPLPLYTIIILIHRLTKTCSVKELNRQKRKTWIKYCSKRLPGICKCRNDATESCSETILQEKLVLEMCKRYSYLAIW